MVVANFGDADPVVEVPGSWVVEVASDGRREGGRWDGRAGATAAVVLRPA